MCSRRSSMPSKTAGKSLREPQSHKKSGSQKPPNSVRPSRNVLQKEFATSITISHANFIVYGNGPHILVREYDLEEKFESTSLSVTEIAVFPQLQVTVRGIIPMPHEKYILAFGANYLAMIGVDQLKEGGHLCQNRIVSTAGVMVGGRRVGTNNIQVFYESGGFETLEVIKKKKIIEIVQKRARKLEIRGAKVTSIDVSGEKVLLGTSDGRVLSHAGKLYLKRDESKGAVRQMTVINEHIVLLLFQNKALALLDLRYHALRSVVEGRFTAIESVFFGGVIIAGDLDGTLHCFRISTKGTQMRLINSSKCMCRDAIIFLFPVNTRSLLYSTAMGSMFFFNREGFVESTAIDVFGGFDVGSQFARTSKKKWYFLKEKRLYFTEGSLCHPHSHLEHADLEVTQLKRYRMNDFEAVYAFGNGNVFIDVTHKKRHRKEFLKFDERITTVVVTEEYLLIQTEKGIMIYVLQESGWKPNLKVSLKSDSKVSAFAKIKVNAHIALFLIAFHNGRVYSGTADPTSEKILSLDLVETLRKDFIVSMQSVHRHVNTITAKAIFSTYVLHPIRDDANLNAPYHEELTMQSRTSYKYVLGRGYDILIIDNGVYLVGFKQKMLNVYKVNEQEILSMETGGPRSAYSINEDSQSTMSATCSLGMVMISRRFPKIARTQHVDVMHAGPITHVLFMFDVPVDSSKGVFADIVTGDCNGLVALMGVSTSAAGSQIVTQMAYQLDGAITCMNRCANYFFVGTSTGALHVFRYTSSALLCVGKIRNSVAITSIECHSEMPENEVTIGLSSGHGAALRRFDGRFEHGEVQSMGETLVDIKWRWSDDKKAFCLSKDGILYTSATDKELTRSIDHPEAQRYSYFKFISIGEGELMGLVVGYYDGMFMFAVHGKELEGWRYFTADFIHRHEIIDSIFYKTPSKSASIWSLATLDKTGLYVQRTLKCDYRGIRLHGFPMMWYCPVRHPKAMVLLEKKKEVIVVGSGLVLSSLAPPPPAK